MVDLVKLKLQAGDGGNGKVAFHREKYITKGGPSGGNGGNGGSIILKVDTHLNTLQHFAGAKAYLARAGQAGGKMKKFGAKGEDIVLFVPQGTVVWLIKENRASHYRRLRYSLNNPLSRSEVKFEKFYLSHETEQVKIRETDEIEEVTFQKLDKQDKGIKIAELNNQTDQLIICQGGFGGKGNDLFKSSTNTTPLEAEYGSFGEAKEIILELKLLADVGLVGLPNAGKSTLISKLTKARPKIANYPFTTLEPNLGIMTYQKKDRSQSAVIADIPGLIEGASHGKGLGFNFLRHVEHCQFLIFVLFLDEGEIFNDVKKDQEKALSIYQQFLTLKQELINYSDSFQQKSFLVTLNKTDLYSPSLLQKINQFFLTKNISLLNLSAITGENLQELQNKIFENLGK